MPNTNKDDDEKRKRRIRKLNDAFRETGVGGGSIFITAGIQALGPLVMNEVIARVQCYKEFSIENDPYGEHDFGAFDLADEKFFWKIDYYDLSLAAGSPNPADETVTHRVLTIMRASEY